MSFANQRHLMMLYALRIKNDLSTMKEAHIARLLHVTPTQLIRIKGVLIEQGFVDDAWNIRNWYARQYKQGEKERKAQNRNIKKQGLISENVPGGAKVSLSDTDTDTDTKTDTENPSDLITKGQLLNPLAPNDFDKSPAAARKQVKKPLKVTVQYDKNTNQLVNTDDLIPVLKAKFPAVDVEAELRRVEAWLYANPTKTKSNYERFLVTWFGKAQDRGGTGNLKNLNPYGYNSKTAGNWALLEQRKQSGYYEKLIQEEADALKRQTEI